jgi:8-oxo-dGTP diphosphatase
MLTVLCGIVYNAQNEIFIARRAPHKAMAGKWEFPGGKLEPGEDHHTALQRELEEELGMRVTVKDYLGTSVYQYPDFKIELIAYTCDFISATYHLTDQDRYAWVSKTELLDYDLTAADKPFLSHLP